jgi:ferric-dicitrate binding protein FerR (iron transport regulator)
MTDINWTLLDRYAAGECDAEEAAALRRWATGHAQREALLASLEERSVEASPHFDADVAWRAVRTRAMATSEPRPRWSRSASALLRAAVIATVLAGGALLARVVVDQQREVGSAFQVARTGRSQSDTLRLSDGSLVILSPASMLEYPQSFGTAARSMRLTGEAFFRVAPDTTRPFSITARNAVVQVVGTEFVVRATNALDSVNGGVTIAVVEGIVAVGAVSTAHDQRVRVERGQVAEVTRDGQTQVVIAADIDRYVAWMGGTLVFENATLAELLAELERWYSVEFRAEGAALAARRVTARLQTHSLGEALDALTLALGAHYRQTGDTIFISQNQP